MAGRKRALDWVAYTQDSENYLGHLTAWGLDVSAQTDDCSGGNAVLDANVITKRRATHGFTVLHKDNTGACGTNLDISVFTIGGDAYLGDLTSGNINAQHTLEDGDGVADQFAFPNITKKAVSMDATLLIPDDAVDVPLLHSMLDDSGTTQLSVSVVINLGLGLTLTLPAVMTATGYSKDRGALDKLNVSFMSSGATITANSPTQRTIFTQAMTGDAVLAMVATVFTDEEYQATGVIESLSVAFNNGAITTMSGTMAIQGTVDVDPA